MHSQRNITYVSMRFIITLILLTCSHYNVLLCGLSTLLSTVVHCISIAVPRTMTNFGHIHHRHLPAVSTISYQVGLTYSLPGVFLIKQSALRLPAEFHNVASLPQLTSCAELCHKSINDSDAVISMVSCVDSRKLILSPPAGMEKTRLCSNCDYFLIASKLHI